MTGNQGVQYAKKFMDLVLLTLRYGYSWPGGSIASRDIMVGTKSKNGLLPCTTDQNKQQSRGENAILKERTCGPERPIVTDWALVGPSSLGKTRISLYGLARLTPSRWAPETPSTWQPVSLSAVLRKGLGLSGGADLFTGPRNREKRARPSEAFKSSRDKKRDRKPVWGPNRRIAPGTG
ncbi:hypothetical protein KQX54_002029 [Cotesia glomerata]|uniref:Uncharacterized protein n=1 Tax=Cotesia glomerata TaxID=32391 RepID=A0AAV7I8V4_COTGL|nr:hypothetical protein KQX54_002029 [Cotesia glomerata]